MMNKFQEALNICRSTKLYQDGKMVKDIGLLRKRELDILQELVDKGTPMKPKEYYSCPNCGCVVVDEYKYFDYCPDCGIKLDWGNSLEDTCD